MTYFEIVDCVWRDEARWHLSEPEANDGSKQLTWSFTRCERFGSKGPLRMRLRTTGKPVDFTFGAFDIPVLSPHAVRVLSPWLAESCEFIPVEIENQSPGYAILNILQSEDCVDEEASELIVWKSTDQRPDKTGQYRQISKLVLKSGLPLPPIFRLERFKITILVSDTIAEIFKRDRLTGVRLEPR